jgi:sporulation protein YlmC with PRC-barrel domain
MKRIIVMLAISIVALTLAVSGAYAGEMKSTSSDIMKGSKLIGAAVENNQGEKLGKISDLVYDARENRLTFAILSHGGVLGVGDKLIPVPISALTFRSEDTAVLDITKEKLATAPSFEKSKWPDMANRQWIDDTHRYFGVSPKWEHKGEMKEEMKKEGEKEKGKYGY